MPRKYDPPAPTQSQTVATRFGIHIARPKAKSSGTETAVVLAAPRSREEIASRARETRSKLLLKLVLSRKVPLKGARSKSCFYESYELRMAVTQSHSLRILRLR